MIGFGCSIISPEVYRRCAEPGIVRARERDSIVFACQAAGSIFRSYNMILDRASECDQLEALVLVHEDAEILDPDFCQKLRGSMRDPEIAVVGCVGAENAPSIAWWEGSRISGSFLHRYPELGGGEFHAYASGGDGAQAPRGVSEVHTVDGLMLALSPWAVRNVRFDESLGPHWGYDYDYCRQVRAAGRKVATADLRMAHYGSLALVSDTEAWVAAHRRAADKWESRRTRGAEPEVDWRPRARRAEAAAVVARLEGASKLLQADARSAEHARRLEQVLGTSSWRLTRPLRKLNGRRRAWQNRQSRTM